MQAALHLFLFFLKGGQLFLRLVSVSFMFCHFLYKIFSSSIHYVLFFFLLSLIRNVVQSRPCKPQDFAAVAMTTIRNPKAIFPLFFSFFFFLLSNIPVDGKYRPAAIADGHTLRKRKQSCHYNYYFLFCFFFVRAFHFDLCTFPPPVVRLHLFYMFILTLFREAIT